MLVRMANRKDPDKKQSDLGLHSFVFQILEHLPCNILEIDLSGLIHPNKY